MIIKCDKCKEHKFQDKRYGDKNRVHNKTSKTVGEKTEVFRCTVCGAERSK